MSKGTPYIGTSGWAYREWRGNFYPRGLLQREELGFYAERLPATDYSDQALDLWAQRVRQWLDGGLDTYVFFDNTAAGHAPVNAEHLLALVER